MKLKSFGQKVYAEITDENEQLVFSTKGSGLADTNLSEDLRVDFEIRIVESFDVAIVKIFNVKSATAKMISSDQKWVTVWASLHGEDYRAVAHKYFVSNVITVKKVPDSITTLYCEHSVKKNFLEGQSTRAFGGNSSLRTIFSDMTKDYPGVSIKDLWIPTELMDHNPPNPYRNTNISNMGILRGLGEEFWFDTYTQGEGIVAVGKPNTATVQLTALPGEKGIILNVSDMRANPRLGPSSVHIVSNLDLRIIAGVVFDITDLVGIGEADISDLSLAVIKDILNSVGGYSKYITRQVTHKGSNYSDLWETKALGIAPNGRIELTPIYNSLI